ncbi:MAG: hypothetical protein ACI9LE_000427 [Paraglaciecola sp.]
MEPIYFGLLKNANLPRRFIPAALAFGSVTFNMTSAGSTEIQNWSPIKYLGTSHFEARDHDPEIPVRDYPHPFTGIVTFFVVLVLSSLLHESLQQLALIVVLVVVYYV